MKGKNHRCGPCTFACSSTSCTSLLMEVAALRRGTIDECNVEDAEKRFHVVAASLEARSANRRHCCDMEVLFSIFHIGDVGIGVMGRGHGHYLVGMWCVCGFIAGRWC